jgi:hypothetical protein
MVFRQGDVLLTPTEYLRGTKLPNLTLAEGELTGHAHRITQGDAELYQNDEILYLKVLSPSALLTHEEHQSIEIPRGDWQVRIQREYTPVKQWRKVID